MVDHKSKIVMKKPKFSDLHEYYIEKNKKEILYRKENNIKTPFSGIAICEYDKNQNLRWLLDNYETSSLLDYGCGPAKAYEEGLCMYNLLYDKNIDLTLYDPSFENNNVFPEKTSFDGVICVDVLEHVPDSDTKEVLDYLFSVAKKWIYLFISTKKNSGRYHGMEYFHINLKTPQEWCNIINNYAKEYPELPIVLSTDYPGEEIGFNFNSKSEKSEKRFITLDTWNISDEHDKNITNDYKVNSNFNLRYYTRNQEEKKVNVTHV